MNTIEKELILNVDLEFIEIRNEEKLFIITSSQITFEMNDHSLTKFQTCTNNRECEIIVNCGLTPPQIFFNFLEEQEQIEIDHDYQTNVINELKKFESKNVVNNL